MPLIPAPAAVLGEEAAAGQDGGLRASVNTKRWTQPADLGLSHVRAVTRHLRRPMRLNNSYLTLAVNPRAGLSPGPEL